MTPQEFIAKWQGAELSERSACQQHFLDLCDLLEQPKPVEADSAGTGYTFNRGVAESDRGQGWADVWKSGCFAWEYGGKHQDLKAAYQQLLLYRENLDDPPFLVVCDVDRFEVHTNVAGIAKQVDAFDLDGLRRQANLAILRKLFSKPESLRPDHTKAGVTERAAEHFGKLADGMRQRVAAHRVAHFLMKLMFCMFAEDIGLLRNKVFSRVLEGAHGNPAKLTTQLQSLFDAVRSGSRFGADKTLHFGGGPFTDSVAIDLTPDEIAAIQLVNSYEWSNVEPSIFGTLFERTLDPAKRSQMGAHYTSREEIVALLEPVLMTPLRREWNEVKATCRFQWTAVQEAAGKREQPGRRNQSESAARRKIASLLRTFVERLSHVKILDPACGSGNFLYIAIDLLLDLEKEVIAYAAARGLPLLPLVHPNQLYGIEVNPYAQQLAQLVIWIGYFQWKYHNGFRPPGDLVVETLERIVNEDAIVDLSDPAKPREPVWPAADFIVGNPPFLHGSKMRAELGDAYVESLFRMYSGRVSGFADLCCYWIEKSRAQVESQTAKRVGLLATQGIRGGASRDVLRRVLSTGAIFFAESDRDWLLDGASVHVSMVGFDDGSEDSCNLNGKPVPAIHSNLTAGIDVTLAMRISGQSERWCYGSQEKADFGIPQELALAMMAAANPAAVVNSDVIKPSLGGRRILQQRGEDWVIDFGDDRDLESAARYAAPFEHVKSNIFAHREKHREPRQRNFWWLHARPSPRYRRALKSLPRYVVTPASSKHRVFVWKDSSVLVDHATIVFPCSDDYWFGVLHSRVHELWARVQATQVRERESGLRYTPKTCFETFRFPDPADSQREAIANAARELDGLRNDWLNPAEWTRREVLQFPGSKHGPWARYVVACNQRGIGTVCFERTVAKDKACEERLRRRTLTNLYNERPAWLELAHRRLDEAVLDAYGWQPDVSDDEMLLKLLELNHESCG